jgi:hypothetical protein
MASDADMARNREFEAIQKEKALVAKKLAAIDRDRAMLEQQASELAVTERTLARILGVDLPQETGGSTSNGSKAGGKPKKLPSIYQMMLALLAEAPGGALEVQDAMRLIRERWWPSAERNDIAPTLWRLAKTGKLKKDGTSYALPETEEPSTASQ